MAKSNSNHLNCLIEDPPIQVLDHGFIRVVDYMGTDQSVVQAARVSYGEGTKSIREDAGLIDYLLRHKHTTPFEMCELKLHVKMPIFVARQWIRHRTANVNEYSARYSVLDMEYYIPKTEHIAGQSTANKQGRDEPLPEREAAWVQEFLLEESTRAFAVYNQLIEGTPDGQNDTPKLARELARIILPLNVYTQWYWKIDLHNLMHFLKLRTDPHAQYEIRAYADVIEKIVQAWVPLCFDAYRKHSKQAMTLSADGVEYVKRVVASGGHVENLAPPPPTLSKRERDEIDETFIPRQ